MDGHGIHLTVRSLRAQNNGAEISVTVVFEDGENSETRTLLITMEQYCALNPRKGPISEEQFERLEQASRCCMAVRCGENLLAYGANSAQALSRKIMRHGFSREEALSAVAQLQESGLIDERGDMRREVEKCLRKLWGAGKIRAHLWSKGFCREVLEELPQVLENVNFAENCARMIQKHYGGLPQDPAELRRMTAGLYQYGYTSEEIRRALRNAKEL